MPARVHAFLYVRADDRPDAHLARTLAALTAQSRPVDALTIVIAGHAQPATMALVEASGAEGVVVASRTTRFAQAMGLAARRVGDADALWLLGQDTAPEPDALRRLVGALDVQPSVAVFAPKLIRWDEPSRIVSLGVSMTAYGRAVGLADGEFDQGQHDGDDDVLGADVRGMLVRHDAWRALGGIDPALFGADDGLDLSVRARLAGHRVAVVPRARLAVAGDGAIGPTAPLGARGRRRALFETRIGQRHRRLVYAPAALLPLHWLSYPPLVVFAAILALVRKAPRSIAPDAAATLTAWIRLRDVARARRRIAAGGARVPWSRLDALRVDRRQLRDRLALDGIAPEPDHRGELRFFSGGGAWVVLGAALVSIVAFFSLLAWPALGGGALLPMRTTVAGLWADAAYGQRALGWDLVGPADPFAAVVAVIGSLTAWAPAQGLLALWLLALPLAALAGWMGATRLTARAWLRAAGAAGWALAPPFVSALVDGRPGAVIAHLLLPWLLICLAASRRSLAAASGAGLLAGALLAAAPSLAVPALVLWLGALVTAGRGAGRTAWALAPPLALAAPLVWERAIVQGDPLSLLADPGAPPVAPGAPPAWALLGGWGRIPLGWDEAVHLVPVLLLVPFALLALLSPLTSRWRAGGALLAIALLGTAVAFAAPRIAVTVTAAGPIGLDPGPAASLAWLGVLGAAVAALDAGGLRRPVLRGLAGTVAIAAVAVAVAPALALPTRGGGAIQNGPVSTLPAYVAAVGDGARSGTLVIDARADGYGARIVWGGSETLGGQTTLLSAPGLGDGGTDAARASDDTVAAVVADLVTGADSAGTASLADQGIAFVLVDATPESAGEDAAARRAQAIAALDARGSLVSVGEETGRGALWRVGASEPEAAGIERAEPPASVALTGRLVALAQIAVMIIAVLLAVPTLASRRAARRHPRLLGLPRTARDEGSSGELDPLAEPLPEDDETEEAGV